jgi:ribulose-phosphate 3-epimerase
MNNNINYKLSASILSADFSNLKSEIRSVERANYLHLDVMDGNFVKNISFGPKIIKDIRSITNMIFDLHLMIIEPYRYIENFVSSGADIITIHLEACENLVKTIKKIKYYKKKVSVALKPNTELKNIYPILELIDMVLIMSVEPGFGGQELIKNMLNKSYELKNFATKNNLKFDIEMDGGINLENFNSVLNAGVNIFVVGSSLFKSDKRMQTIDNFRNKINNYVSQLS